MHFNLFLSSHDLAKFAPLRKINRRRKPSLRDLLQPRRVQANERGQRTQVDLAWHFSLLFELRELADVEPRGFRRRLRTDFRRLARLSDDLTQMICQLHDASLSPPLLARQGIERAPLQKSTAPEVTLPDDAPSKPILM